MPFSSYPDLVYAPHVYTHAFTLDQFLGYPAQDSPYPPSYTFGYQTAEYEAQAMHSAVFTTEYGADAGSDPVPAHRRDRGAGRHATSSTLWAWKGLSDQQSAAGACGGSRAPTTPRPTARREGRPPRPPPATTS